MDLCLSVRGTCWVGFGRCLVLELPKWVDYQASKGHLVVLVVSLGELKVLTGCETSDRNCGEDLLTMNLNFPKVHFETNFLLSQKWFRFETLQGPLCDFRALGSFFFAVIDYLSIVSWLVEGEMWLVSRLFPRASHSLLIQKISRTPQCIPQSFLPCLVPRQPA